MTECGRSPPCWLIRKTVAQRRGLDVTGGRKQGWPWAENGSKSRNTKEEDKEEEEEEEEDEREPIPVARAAYDMGWRPLGCWDCGFESRRGVGCLSLVSVVCCRVEVSATGRSLVQRDPTESVCVSPSVIKCKQ
jgi:hypothetical protein